MFEGLFGKRCKFCGTKVSGDIKRSGHYFCSAEHYSKYNAAAKKSRGHGCCG